jgi:hypothetical protein
MHVLISGIFSTHASSVSQSLAGCKMPASQRRCSLVQVALTSVASPPEGAQVTSVVADLVSTPFTWAPVVVQIVAMS